MPVLIPVDKRKDKSCTVFHTIPWVRSRILDFTSAWDSMKPKPFMNLSQEQTIPLWSGRPDDSLRIKNYLIAIFNKNLT
jgi:hypothetical protein